jgi:hypothetical protein
MASANNNMIATSHSVSDSLLRADIEREHSCIVVILTIGLG